MSLQGSLRQLDLADILQGALAGRKGNVHLRNGVNRAIFHVDAHQLRMVAPDTVNVETLIEGLIYRGVIDATTYAEASADRTPIEALDHMVDIGKLPQPEIDQVLRGASEDAILDLLTWNNGEFLFREDESHGSGLLARVSVDMGGVLLRSAQRLDERCAITDHLGLDSHLFVACEKLPSPEYEGDPVVQVHALLDGRRVVDEVAVLSGLTRFATLRSILACVQEGNARAATVDEIRGAIQKRTDRGQTQVARSLLRQWASIEPERTGPLEMIVKLAREENQTDEEADTLLTLAHVHLQTGQQDAAVPILKELVAKRPGDQRALSTLASVAEATGDTDLHARTVIQLARAAIADDEPDRAAQLLTRLVSSPDAPLAARVLRGRAFFALRDPKRLIAEADAVVRTINKKVRSREQKEALAFFRDAISTLAPDRTDVLSQLGGGRRSAAPSRRIALLTALLLLAATAGFVLWPETPASLLGRAHDAAAVGDNGEALRLISDLAERFPDAPETMEAFALQSQLTPKRRKPAGTRKPKKIEDEHLLAAIATCEQGLALLPDAVAIKSSDALATLLDQELHAIHETAVLERLEPALIDSLGDMVRRIRTRTDLISRAERLTRHQKADEDSLREVVGKADAWRGDGFTESVAASRRAIETLFAARLSSNVRKGLRRLGQAQEQFDGAQRSQGDALDECRRRVGRLDLQAAYGRCLTEASRLLVTGRFDGAKLCYTNLQKTLDRLAADPLLAPIADEATRRGIPEFLSSRRATLIEIQQGLEGAKAAEAAGDRIAAATAYASLARKFSHIRFESVIQVPLGVRTVPAGAALSVNGAHQGRSPVEIHYPWATQITLTASAPGYETVTHLLGAGDANPPGDLLLTLRPEPLWSAPVDPAVIAPPVAAGRNVLICDRGGRAVLHSGSDGHVVWARHIESLEGIRARPAVAGGLVYLPFVDGRVWILEQGDGRPIGTLSVGRTAGDPAVLGTVVAIATYRGRLTLLRGSSKAADVAIGGTATAGVLAAHGAFWVGTAEGRIVRIDPRGNARAVELPGRRVPVLGLAVCDGGILATKADGTLHAVDTTGRRRWLAEAVGELVGTPAAAPGLAACIDTRGRILLFSLADGSPRGQLDLGKGPKGGLISVEGLLATCLDDGRVWVHDPATHTDRLAVDLGGAEARFGAALLGTGRLAVPAADGTLLVFDVPTAAEGEPR